MRAKEAHRSGWPAEAAGPVWPELIGRWPSMIPATKAERMLQVGATVGIQVRERVEDARVCGESGRQM